MQREAKIKAAVLIFFILNIIIIGASIHGVSATYQQSAHDAFAVILAFSLILLVLGAAAVFLIHRSQSGGGSKSKKNYDVAGKVNKAFKNDAEAGKDISAEKKNDLKKNGDEKWVSNYVPHGEYPSGKEAAVMESVNEIEVKEREPAPVNVTENNKNEDAKSSSSSSSSSSSEDEKKDSSKEDKE